MFSRRAAYARSMLLTCACADLRGKHRQPTRTCAPILHRLAYADPTQTYALQAKSYAADFQSSRLYVALLLEKKNAAHLLQTSTRTAMVPFLDLHKVAQTAWAHVVHMR